MKFSDHVGLLPNQDEHALGKGHGGFGGHGQTRGVQAHNIAGRLRINGPHTHAPSWIFTLTDILGDELEVVHRHTA